jgi:elongator complex protein 3
MNHSILKDLLYQDFSSITNENLEKCKRRWSRSLGDMPKNSDILAAYKQLVVNKLVEANPQFESLITTRKIRTLSGVAPFAVMMKPYFCPGQCTYCVLEPGMPKSYMSDEPAAARAKMLQFDPKQQVLRRIEQMEKTGHKPEKLQIIVIGGTFSAYPDTYKKEFLLAIFTACNNSKQISPTQTIQEVQHTNESAKHRIIGMSIETRPDWVTDQEIRLLREYGVTKVQLGVQALDNTINRLTKRGHTVDAVRTATQKLRDAGFKINYHFMPNLPGSNPKKDVAMCKQMFSDTDFRPDTLKIYPCIVIPRTALWAQWRQGKYHSYDDHTLADVLVQCVQHVPYYCRIDRLVRDITRQWTASGTKKTNMRQIVDRLMQQQNIVAKDIRAREVRNRRAVHPGVILTTKRYKANKAWEYFISFEDSDYLYGMIRLRLPQQPNPMTKVFPVLHGAALVRELQVFGKQVGISSTSTNEHSNSKRPTQHQSLGKQLVHAAEAVARSHGYEHMAIISGVGVRQYYRNLGYELKDTYMVKRL